MPLLTIVIPTFNRHHHLSRLINYYQNIDIEARFLILDSSSLECREKNSRLIQGAGNYFKYIEFPESIAVASKISEGLSKVETEFCALCADDDFIFPNSVLNAVNFLKNNPDFVCVDGIYLNFNPINKESLIQVQCEYGSAGIDSHNPFSRVFRLFQKYESMFYAVFRARDLKEIFNSLHQIPSLHYQELFQSVAALLKGKTHRLSEYYAARQHCEPADGSRDKWQTYYWFSENSSEFLSHYISYRNTLWDYYCSVSEETQLDNSDFISAIDKVHAMFFSLNFPPQYFHGELAFTGDMGEYIPSKDLIPAYESLKRSISLPFPFGRLPVVLNSLIEFTESMVAKQNILFANKIKRVIDSNNGWHCSLSPNILWMAEDSKFIDSFNELCKYLGRPTS